MMKIKSITIIINNKKKIKKKNIKKKFNIKINIILINNIKAS